MYADITYYKDKFGGTVLTGQTATSALEKASCSVDILTFNRIKAEGFECLTEFQQETVRRCVCSLAEWQYANADALASPYKQYSINGVSAAVGASDTVRCVGGVLVPSEVYALLITTGLCYGGV